jgi:hypothetical protein
MPYGAIRHFPAGTYDKQMSTWTGRKELSLISIVHSAWYMFKHLSLGEWGENERKMAKWLMEELPPLPPTRRLDDVIASLWHVSPWAYRVITGMIKDG